MIFWNFFKAWVRVQWAKRRGFEVLAPPEVAAARFQKCELCPFFDGAQCELCGCLAMAKTMIAVEYCPKNEWGARWIKRNAA